MRERLITTAVIFLALLCFASVQMRAEIPIVQADTVFQGFPGGGSVSEIVFGPTGETVFVIFNEFITTDPGKYNVKPIEINIKTKQIVREFEQVPNAYGSSYLIFDKNKGLLSVSTRCNELFGITDFSGNVFWDINTGKITKSIPNVVLLYNGQNYYSFIIKDKKEFIGLFDINTFKFADSVEFDQYWYNGKLGRSSAGFGIIPNSNKVIIGANTKGRSTLYVLDFDTKKYTEIPIPFEKGQDSSEIIDIKVSETGKYFVVSINQPFDYTAYLFYDKEYKFLFKESRKHLNELTENQGNDVMGWVPYFIHDDYIMSSTMGWNVSKQEYFYFLDFYSISEKSIKKRILLEQVSDIAFNNNDICGLFTKGKIGLLTLDALPVQENKTINPENQAEFQDGKIILDSQNNEIADIDILDYKGNLINSKKGVNITKGLNRIPLDVQIGNGVYFCILKTKHGDFSYKFLVSR